MLEVGAGLFVGTKQDRFRDPRDGCAVVYACKNPCYAEAVGCRGGLLSDHQHYLLLQEEQNLFMNLIDPEEPLFMIGAFTEFRSFASEYSVVGANLLLHCNQGSSRASSLPLLFLAMDVGELPNESYRTARREYEEIDPAYDPGGKASRNTSATTGPSSDRMLRLTGFPGHAHGFRPPLEATSAGP